jgi:hypothetical protein
MNIDLNQDQRDALEGLMDVCGVQAVLEALSIICGEKADHIEASYDDAVTAKAWRTVEGEMGCASTSKNVAAISR